MGKIKYFLLPALITLMACSGSKDNAEPGAKIDIATPNISISENGNATANFTSSLPWELTMADTKATPSWIDANPKNGGAGEARVVITAQKNTTSSSRTAYIKITAGSTSSMITVTQGKNSTITLDKIEQNISSSAGSFMLEITSTGAWSSTGIPTWMTLKPSSGTTSGTILVNYQENKLPQPRKATIDFSNGTDNTSLTVTQLGTAPVVMITPSSPQDMPANGGKISVTIISNTTWMVKSDKTWATSNLTNGNGNGTVIISVAANTSAMADMATITFNSSNASPVALTINRAAPQIVGIIDKTNVTVPANSSSFNVNVTSNSSWNTSGIPDWIKLTPGKGSGNTVVKVNYEANTSSNARSATIIFSSNGVNSSLVVTQANKQLDDFDKETWQ